MDNIVQQRRTVVKWLGLMGGMAATPIPAVALAKEAASESDAANDAYWQNVRAAFGPQQALLNLNNAGVSPQPLVVMETLFSAYRFANEQPDVNMWYGRLDTARASAKKKLATLVDCEPSELALNRNSTEGLCTAIFGIELRAGDEVVLGNWDYPSMRNAWEQRVQRDGIVIRAASFDLLGSDEAIISAYTQAITPRTKVLHLTHMLHWCGRVLPVEPLCALAKERGILTIVDAAQSFAHIPISFRKMDCDYLAASLHKWLCAPLGTGMLVLRASLIDKTWPLVTPHDVKPVGIEKFEYWNLGTYNTTTDTALEPAVDFHNQIGSSRKHARLRELSRYWIERVAEIKGFKMHTPIDTENLGGLTLFSIDGIKVETIEKALREEHNIRVRLRRYRDLAGVRVSPHIYTSKSDLDRFVAAVHQVAKKNAG